MTRVGLFLPEAVPYILQVFVGVVALVALSKDWKDYDFLTKPIRLGLLVIVAAIVPLSMSETCSTRNEAKRKEQAASQKDSENKGQIDALSLQVRQGRDENTHSADGFRQSFKALYDKYSDLAVGVKNADLRRELALTRNEVKAAEAKMTQPKARLAASFWYPTFTFDNLQQEVTVSKRLDGSVTFDVAVFNPSEVAALNGSFTVRICEFCKFTHEPNGSVHIAGSHEQDRQFLFGRIFSNAVDQKYTIEVTPPERLLGNRFEVEVTLQCVNCVESKQVLWVNVQ